MAIEALLAAALAWLVSRIIKIAIDTTKEGKFIWKMLLRDGGMPSGHTAIMAGLVTALYIETKFSYLFAISLIMLFIVVNDALKVRHLTGEQSKAINRLTKGKKGFPVLEERAGHTLLEVIAGAIIGIIVPIIFYSLI